MKIRKGHCVGFLGPNGAGKSTTIKILCSLIYPSKGEAYVNGFNPSKEPRNALADVGCIVEVPDFYPQFNASEVLRYCGKIRGITGLKLKTKVKEVLELAGLSKWARTRTSKFSRGMKQRLGVAQLLLHDPRILILDEPALGLDPRGVVEVRKMLEEIVKQDKTIFLASHMLYEVQEVCDVVALINKGKLIAYDEVGNLEKLFKVKVLEVDLLQPPTPKQLRGIEKLKLVKSYSTKRNHIKINFDGDKAAQVKLLATLVEDIRLQVTSFRPSLAALEEIYMQLVKE
jgi:ABC-2 type transport system ATP-binding protein